MKKYQQGDVLLHEIAKSKVIEHHDSDMTEVDNHNLVLVTPDLTETGNRKVILALGEGTGHHHRFESNNVQGLMFKNTYIRQSNEIECDYIKIENQSATLYHEEHNPISIDAGFYKVSIVRERDHISQITRRVWD